MRPRCVEECCSACGRRAQSADLRPLRYRRSRQPIRPSLPSLSPRIPRLCLCRTRQCQNLPRTSPYRLTSTLHNRRTDSTKSPQGWFFARRVDLVHPRRSARSCGRSPVCDASCRRMERPAESSSARCCLDQHFRRCDSLPSLRHVLPALPSRSSASIDASRWLRPDESAPSSSGRSSNSERDVDARTRRSASSRNECCSDSLGRGRRSNRWRRGRGRGHGGLEPLSPGLARTWRSFRRQRPPVVDPTQPFRRTQAPRHGIVTSLPVGRDRLHRSRLPKRRSVWQQHSKRLSLARATSLAVSRTCGSRCWSRTRLDDAR